MINKKYIYYFIIIVLFLIVDKLICLVPNNSFNDYYLIKEENDRLKADIKYLSNINYDYNYELCKISIKNLYSSNTYFIECNFNTDNNIVLNDLGFIGLVNKGMLTLTKDLTLSVSINDNKGILKNNNISIINGEYNIGDNIYVNYLNEKYLIGYVDNIFNNNISIKYLDINNSYVVVLK